MKTGKERLLARLLPVFFHRLVGATRHGTASTGWAR